VKPVASIDLGCGDNKISQHFIGIDIRPTKHTNIVADLKSLRMLQDSSAKLVTSRRVIQHLEDDIEVFREINRILMPDGIAVIEVAGFLNASVSKLLNWLKIKKYRYTVFHVYTKARIEKKIRTSGLKLVTCAEAATKAPFYNHVIIAMKGEPAQNTKT
jgi:ubiquinone/menaquinone biosynthesis C-methylase UbiE